MSLRKSYLPFNVCVCNAIVSSALIFVVILFMNLISSSLGLNIAIHLAASKKGQFIFT